MPFNFSNANIAIRENRLGSITGFVGDLQTLVNKSEDGTLRNRERCFSQSSSCLSGCALNALAAIRNVAVVYHAPAGCTAMASNDAVKFGQIAARVNKTTNSVFVCTDLNEKDTVFGATKDLEAIIRHTYEAYKPDAIFVSTSCVSGVTGEDVDGVASDLDKELPIPVIPVHCEGFKSRIWASGFDISDHAVLQGIVQPPKQKRRTINIKNFYESARPQITKIFNEVFDAEPQFLYCNSTIEELSHLSEALATVCICGTLGTYLGNALEEKYGVPYVRTINHSGITGFETWLRGIGDAIGKRAEAEAYIEKQRAIYLPQIEEVTKQLKGLKAVIGMGPGFTYEIARVLQEFGMTVEYALAWHYDYKYDNGKVPPALEHLLEHSPKDMKVAVADQQNYEVLNILNHYQPDVYFSRHPGTTVWAIKQGFAAVFVADEYTVFGYEGTLSFAKLIRDTVTNRSFEKNLAARIKLPYTKWWYEQGADKFINAEAKK
ncbi:MAG: nitrogenase component 1 [Spirochaetales bacterium]|nr:nitrogenase component 1 [Spirochaetales bacterium]